MVELPEDLDLGTAGAGARGEAERRRRRREQKTREAHPRIGGLLLRLQVPPPSERAWEIGAAGEEALAAHLADRCPDVIVLHDRRMPGSRANIDHIAVAPSGVFVIDAKRYKGKIEIRRPIFGDPVLTIAGRGQTRLVEGLRRQVDAVEKGLAIIEQDVPVHGCFCFLDPAGQAGSGLPPFSTPSINGFPLYRPRKLSRRLNKQGPVASERIAVLAEALIELFPRSTPRQSP
jgi:hypothetical protein